MLTEIRSNFADKMTKQEEIKKSSVFEAKRIVLVTALQYSVRTSVSFLIEL